jgi:hypothetical protein
LTFVNFFSRTLIDFDYYFFSCERDEYSSRTAKTTINFLKINLLAFNNLSDSNIIIFFK